MQKRSEVLDSQTREVEAKSLSGEDEILQQQFNHFDNIFQPAQNMEDKFVKNFTEYNTFLRKLVWENRGMLYEVLGYGEVANFLNNSEYPNIVAISNLNQKLLHARKIHGDDYMRNSKVICALTCCLATPFAIGLMGGLGYVLYLCTPACCEGAGIAGINNPTMTGMILGLCGSIAESCGFACCFGEDFKERIDTRIYAAGEFSLQLHKSSNFFFSMMMVP